MQSYLLTGSLLGDIMELLIGLALEGGASMNRIPSGVVGLPDASTLQAWEDMRGEILHEIQDGGNVPDEQVDLAGDLATLDNPWSVAKPSATPISRFHVN